MLRIDEVVNYILSRHDPLDGEGISNLKLQKLLYYAQGLHFAFRGAPLFNNNIEAWEHGPVVPEVYHRYKQYGESPIPFNPDSTKSDVRWEYREVLDEVYRDYGQFSAWKLREMTHNEPPWLKTPQNAVIQPVLMKDYFRSFKPSPTVITLGTGNMAEFSASLSGRADLRDNVLDRARRIGASTEFRSDGSMRAI